MEIIVKLLLALTIQNVTLESLKHIIHLHIVSYYESLIEKGCDALIVVALILVEREVLFAGFGTQELEQFLLLNQPRANDCVACAFL